MLELSRTAREHADAYGIDAEQVRGAAPSRLGNGLGLEAPWGAQYSLYTREPTARDLFYIVAIVDADGTVQGAHVVPENLSDRKPLKMLRGLVERHGLPTLVWGHEGSYVVPSGRDLPTAPREGAEGVEVLEGVSGAAVQDLTRFSEDDGLQLFMAFAVDAAAVRKAVGLGE